jgi:hypothetical protein
MCQAGADPKSQTVSFLQTRLAWRNRRRRVSLYLIQITPRIRFKYHCVFKVGPLQGESSTTAIRDASSSLFSLLVQFSRCPIQTFESTHPFVRASDKSRQSVPRFVIRGPRCVDCLYHHPDHGGVYQEKKEQPDVAWSVHAIGIRFRE